MRWHRYFVWFGLGWVAGCASSPPTHYYRLVDSVTPVSTEARLVKPTSVEGGRVGVWPAALPELVKRTEIVSYRQNVQVEVANHHLWAEPVQDGFDRIFFNTLERELQVPVERYPWATGAIPNRQLRVKVLHLGGELGQPVRLQAHWSLNERGVAKPLVSGRFDQQVDVASAKHAAYVEGISRLVRELAIQIAIGVTP